MLNYNKLLNGCNINDKNRRNNYDFGHTNVISKRVNSLPASAILFHDNKCSSCQLGAS